MKIDEKYLAYHQIQLDIWTMYISILKATHYLQKNVKFVIESLLTNALVNARRRFSS